MGVFIQAPFWATRYPSRVAPHAVSVVVTPAATIVSSSIAAASVITTLTPHYFVTGDTVTLAGHAGSTPAIDGVRVVTVLTPTTFSIPIQVTVAGTGGTVTRMTPAEPLTIAEGKLRAGLDWLAGDDRDELMRGFIATARAQVEADTGLALLYQVRDLYYDVVYDSVLALPGQSRPLVAVSAITSVDSAGVVQTLAADQYVVDYASGRIGLSDIGVWPTDLRVFQPFVMRIVSGWRTPDLIPAPLRHAVGLLTAHYATLGRDLASVDPATANPFGYEASISPYVPVILA